jgi:hypothetical protein
MNSVHLEMLFLDSEQTLREKLSNLTVPKDTERIQSIISEHFSNLLIEEGDFRQNLTQSEDYILQAVMAILNAHQARYTCLPKTEIKTEPSDETIDVESEDKPKESEAAHDKKIGQKPINLASSSVAAGVGALAGGALAGTWGAVCGAIACTALAAYLVNKNTVDKPAEKEIVTRLIKTEAHFVEKPLDIDMLLGVVKNLCHSVDEIIITFRAQINNVVQKYENQEKPSLEREYGVLLEGIQTLVGYKRAHSEDDKFSKKIQERIEDLAELLENYKLNVVDYTRDNAVLFDFVPSPNTTETKQVYPAIVKEGQLVKKGKVFTPEK